MGVRALWVRFRAIKQDPRQERPAARGSGDWACLGDVPDTKWSPIKWYVRLAQLHGVARDPRSPMFVDKSDVKRPLLYRAETVRHDDVSFDALEAGDTVEGLFDFV